MCGFLTLGSQEYELTIFEEALKEIEGRGPDQKDYRYAFHKIWGFNRLSIMDLSSKGMQPFVYQESILVCNGEIYNYCWKC